MAPARPSAALLALFLLGGSALLMQAKAASLQISSPDFAPGAAIPAKYGKAHANLSPALQIKGIPAKAQTLALIVDDPDAPSGLFTHWVVWNIPVHTPVIREGKVPHGAEQGTNSNGDAHYDGPIPPSGTHRYYFHLFALDSGLSLPAGASRSALESAMQGHVVAQAETFGTFRAGG